ncbi:MAG: AAA family ATPase [Deltaproteobacteria bacterium]|jgi:hypothetical protein|nr:AAA family ATPase [Deltaproteobacteria bacterium]
MKRILFDDMKRWKDNARRKPLIVKGVRQCGKTFLLKKFGETCYEDVAYFNFEGNKALGERFEHDLNVARIITELGILRQKVIEPEKTLIIFDEIQFCNQAMTSLSSKNKRLTSGLDGVKVETVSFSLLPKQTPGQLALALGRVCQALAAPLPLSPSVWRRLLMAQTLVCCSLTGVEK